MDLRVSFGALALAFSPVSIACSGAAADGETGSETAGEPGIGTQQYETQPMVVDVLVPAAADAQIDLEVLGDAGARWVEVENVDDPDIRRIRVRGLAPDTDETLRVSVDGASEDIDITTLAALPGYVGQFDVTSTGAPLAPGMRMFDMGGNGAEGVFEIDLEGRTRWFLGEVIEMVNPDTIWAGVTLRPDGTVSFIRDGAAVVVDELGNELMHVSADELGVEGIHHDLIELPNGNWVALGYTFEDHDYPGLGTIPYAGDTLVEFTSDGELLWTWDSFDWLDPQYRTEPYVDNWPAIIMSDGEPAYDWTHGNGVVYRESDDSFLLSLRHVDWMVSIDHASGDMNWRLGPNGDVALTEGEWFYHPHSPQWQADGSLLMYDNGVNNPGLDDELEHSRAVRYEIDEGAMTASRVWTDDSELFVSPVAGDANTLSNGNVFRLDSFMFDAMGNQFSRMNELDPSASPMSQWELTTPFGMLSYRSVQAERWVGETQ